jgi:hypothetical protein
MLLLAESTKHSYCPLCGNRLGDYEKEELEDDYNYLYYTCGKCEATQIEEVYTTDWEYISSNAWKPMN